MNGNNTNNFLVDDLCEDEMHMKTLRVTNVDLSISVQQLKEIFETYGNVNRVKKVNSFAFIHFDNKHDALCAMNDLNGLDISDRKIEINLVKPPPLYENTTEIVDNSPNRPETYSSWYKSNTEESSYEYDTFPEDEQNLSVWKMCTPPQTPNDYIDPMPSYEFCLSPYCSVPNGTDSNMSFDLSSEYQYGYNSEEHNYPNSPNQGVADFTPTINYMDQGAMPVNSLIMSPPYSESSDENQAMPIENNENYLSSYMIPSRSVFINKNGDCGIKYISVKPRTARELEIVQIGLHMANKHILENTN